MTLLSPKTVMAALFGQPARHMTIPEILKGLEPYTGKFPMKAMRAAIEQREGITPELLRVVEAVAQNPEEYAGRRFRTRCSPPFHGMKTE